MLVPDENVFEISDFTAATEWERFIVVVEKQLYDWKLCGRREVKLLHKVCRKRFQGELHLCQWNLQHKERLSFGTSNFELSLYAVATNNEETSRNVNEDKATAHYALPMFDVMDASNDFISTLHPVAKWFGLREFIILTPFTKSDLVITEHLRCLLLSAFQIAASSTNCEVPMFVQYGELWRELYFGICQNQNMRAHFDMVHMKHCVPKHRYLAGLLDLFREKVGCSLPSPPPVRVAARLKYELSEGFDTSWSQEPPSLDVHGSLGTMAYCEVGVLPFGAARDPISKFLLYATWTQMSEEVLIENDVYSDFDPVNAPFWSLRVQYVDSERIPCLLADFLSGFMEFSLQHVSIEAALGLFALESNDAAHALDRLTGTAIPRLGESSGRASPVAKPASRQRMPIADKLLSKLLSFVFADALSDFDMNMEVDHGNDEELSTTAASSASGVSYGAFPGAAVKDRLQSNETLNVSETKLDMSQLKVCPQGSLAWRMTLCLLYTLHSGPGTDAFCQLFHELILELRYRWEQGVPLPLLEDGPPELSACLLHQKLQMLNCCIRHKISRHNRSQDENFAFESSGNCAEQDTEDEFFDCAESTEMLDAQRKPEGRLKQCELLTLLNLPDTALYVPVTQDPSSTTEDMLAEQAEMLLQLGNTPNASALRAKLQSASLLSDMQAFKAANPGATLADFIRWYSPRDWLDEEKRLSDRMLIPDNVWQQVWEMARPIPVKRQRRLFDDTREAEKILAWFSSMKIAHVCRLLFPIVFSAAAVHALEEVGELRPVLKTEIESLEYSLCLATKSLEHPHTSYQKTWEIMKQIELFIAKYRALRIRFVESLQQEHKRLKLAGKSADDLQRDQRDFLVQLLKEKEVVLPGASGGVLGQAVIKMFRQDCRLQDHADYYTRPEERSAFKFPPYEEKEFILRWNVPNVGRTSRSCPQRMFATVSNDMFRVAGMFTEDLTFV